MAKFSYGEHLTRSEHIISAKLGETNAKLDQDDVGAPVKLAGDSQFNLCADGDQIEGFCTSVEVFTVDGHSFGGVQTAGFKSVVVDGVIAIGDYVVAAGSGKVKKATAVDKDDATTVRNFHWRYVSGEVGSDSNAEYAGVVLRVA